MEDEGDEVLEVAHEQDRSSIRIERRGAVGEITLDRPERFNSLDVLTARDLRRAGLGLGRDDSIRCIILRGRPEVFCSGVDLEFVRAGGREADLGYLAPGAHGDVGRSGAVFKQVLEYVNSAISEIRRAPKPVVAVVEGIAAAGGLGLALCCDLVIASEDASFEWAYGKTGLSGAESATFLLPRLIGLRGALDFALLSPRLDARDAERRGLVSRVVPVASLAAEVDALADHLADGPTAAVARLKRLLNRAVDMDRLEMQLGEEVEALVASADSSAFAEGLERFFTRDRARQDD